MHINSSKKIVVIFLYSRMG